MTQTVELSDKDLKAVMIKCFNVMDALEQLKKQKTSGKKQKSRQGNKRYKERPSGSFKTEKYANQNKRLLMLLMASTAEWKEVRKESVNSTEQKLERDYNQKRESRVKTNEPQGPSGLPQKILHLFNGVQ